MKSIFVLGDSISIQYGPFLKKYLEPFFKYSRKEGDEEALKDLDLPVGSNGGDSRNILEYLQARKDWSPIDADILLLNCGLHDIKVCQETKTIQVPLEEYKENLQKILNVVNSQNINTIWIPSTNVDDWTHAHYTSSKGGSFDRYEKDLLAYNKSANEIMLHNDIPILDLFSFTKTFGKDAFCDHVHYKQEIQEKQGAFIAGWLANYSLNND